MDLSIDWENVAVMACAIAALTCFAAYVFKEWMGPTDWWNDEAWCPEPPWPTKSVEVKVRERI